VKIVPIPLTSKNDVERMLGDALSVVDAVYLPAAALLVKRCR